MKTVLTLLILFSIYSVDTIAQDTSQWGLPEGAKARLGRGRIFDLKYSPGRYTSGGGEQHWRLAI